MQSAENWVEPAEKFDEPAANPHEPAEKRSEPAANLLKPAEPLTNHQMSKERCEVV